MPCYLKGLYWEWSRGCMLRCGWIWCLILTSHCMLELQLAQFWASETVLLWVVQRQPWLCRFDDDGVKLRCGVKHHSYGMQLGYSCHEISLMWSNERISRLPVTKISAKNQQLGLWIQSAYRTRTVGRLSCSQPNAMVVPATAESPFAHSYSIF